MERRTVKLDVDLAFTVERAGVFGLRIRVPPGLQLTDVGDPELVDQWRDTVEDGQRWLTVDLKGRRLGQFHLPVKAVAPLDLAQGTLPVPLLEVEGLDREEGTLGVFMDPGIKAAAFTAVPILSGDEWDSTMSVEGHKAADGEDMQAFMNSPSPGYFQTMGIRFLEGRDFTTTDAHYFPEGNVSVTRLSEPKNYFWLDEPRGTTVLCGELPCSPTDALWSMSDAELATLLADDMARAGLPLQRPPVAVHVRRLRQAYPIYLNGYEKPLGALDAWAASVPNLLVYGRQGLFAHDNTHHAFAMAYAASDCLAPDGTFDRARWAVHRKEFESHVVED